MAYQKSLLEEYAAIEEMLNNLEAEALKSAKTPDEILTKSAEIKETTHGATKQLNNYNNRLGAPSKLVRRPELPSSELAQRIHNIEQLNESRRQKALDEQKAALVLPELETLTVTLTSTVNELESAPPSTLDQQELALRRLEADKQRLHTLLESIPESAEADELKQKSKWELSRLSEFIKRLGEAVGEKISAISAFLATKAEIEAQLADVNRQLEQDQETLEDMPLTASTSQLAALQQREEKVQALKQKLGNEVKAEKLDEEKNAELDALQRALELISEKIRHVREATQRQIALKEAADELKNKVNGANNQLVALIEQAHRLLNDAAAVPQSYELLANQISSTLKQAQQLVDEDPTADTLQANIAEADAARDKLEKRWQTWLEFVRERNLANNQLDTARSPLRSIEKKGMRGLDEAQEDLASLIVSLDLLIKFSSFYLYTYYAHCFVAGRTRRISSIEWHIG